MTGPHVLVVGGGASGALIAAHLLRDRPSGYRVTVIEPAALGRGLAYGTRSRSHLLNARASNMSAFEDAPQDFVDWLAVEDPGAGADSYAERRRYARYLEHVLLRATDGGRGGRLMHIRDAAVAVTEVAQGVRIELASGPSVVGQAAVLAVGHGLLAGPPAPLASAPEGDVLILGTGLGMVDEVLNLIDVGHAGRIVALSRRGQAPQAHRSRGRMRLDPADVPFGTSLSWLMRWLRAEAEAEMRAGVHWGDLVDAVRPHVPQIWGNLPPEARRRFLRHLRPWWDSHRHRMAPEIARRIHGAQSGGRLTIAAGRVLAREDGADGSLVTWRPRGSGEIRSGRFARVIDCTGPRHGPVAADGLLSSLIAAGVARPDPLGLGIEVGHDFGVLRRAGPLPSRRIYAIGPITAPLAWEAYAVPEIRRQCALLTRALGSTLADLRDWPRAAQIE